MLQKHSTLRREPVSLGSRLEPLWEEVIQDEVPLELEVHEHVATAGRASVAIEGWKTSISELQLLIQRQNPTKKNFFLASTFTHTNDSIQLCHCHLFRSFDCSSNLLLMLDQHVKSPVKSHKRENLSQ